MRIEKYLWQNRRDFSAIYVCQFYGKLPALVTEWKECEE